MIILNSLVQTKRQKPSVQDRGRVMKSVVAITSSLRGSGTVLEFVKSVCIGKESQAYSLSPIIFF